jgi:hypothetical protein
MEEIQKILEGAIDFHIHTGPDPYRERSVDALTAAREAKELGMRGVVLKSHDYPTVPLARMLEEVIHGVKMVGSLVLNHAVGGINPQAVDASARMGAKVVWMPTLSSLPDTMRRGLGGGIRILGNDGGVLSEVKEVIALAQKNGLALCTGHISREEIFAFVDAALAMDLEKIVVTHPLARGVGESLSLADQKELAARGAFIEHCFVATTPTFGGLAPEKIAEAIRNIGVGSCIVSTDLGQIQNPRPAEGMKIMIESMLGCGFTGEELEVLVKENPGRILDL